METARRAANKNENMVYIYEKLLEMELFPSKVTLLTKKYSQALFQVGKDNLYFNYGRIARRYFLKSLRVKFAAKAVAALWLSLLPKVVRIALRYTKPEIGRS